MIKEPIKLKDNGLVYTSDIIRFTYLNGAEIARKMFPELKIGVAS